MKLKAYHALLKRNKLIKVNYVEQKLIGTAAWNSAKQVKLSSRSTQAQCLCLKQSKNRSVPPQVSP